jgi:2-hydroxychromene-2-carboxylate isomerase
MTITPITFWFDPISPYAYLAFEHLPIALADHSVLVDYKPVLFGALLRHHEHKGPAEIEPKRQWTFRQVAWLAHTLQLPLEVPAQHPFNPLELLRRLTLRASDAGLCSRHDVEQVLRHVWTVGGHPLDPDRLEQLDAALSPQADGSAEHAKALLRQNTEEAVAKGVFGVPTFECRGHLFWGLDALPMLQAFLSDDPWFATHWEHAARKVPGLVRS